MLCLMIYTFKALRIHPCLRDLKVLFGFFSFPVSKSMLPSGVSGMGLQLPFPVVLGGTLDLFAWAQYTGLPKIICEAPFIPAFVWAVV